MIDLDIQPPVWSGAGKSGPSSQMSNPRFTAAATLLKVTAQLTCPSPKAGAITAGRDIFRSLVAASTAFKVSLPVAYQASEIQEPTLNLPKITDAAPAVDSKQ